MNNAHLVSAGPAARLRTRSATLLTLLVPVLAILAGGCAHLRERETAFFEGAERGIEDARRYAVSRLRNLSGRDLQTVAQTRPAISHVDYERVHYRWTNLCTVLSTPPPCQPYMVLDQRRSP
jgi:hypothetical protein